MNAPAGAGTPQQEAPLYPGGARREARDDEDSAALGLDPHALTHTALADLPTATYKARRDAPAIALCEM